MTDRPDDELLARRLGTWFESEVRMAAADLRRAPLRSRRAITADGRSVVRVAAPIVGIVLVAVVGIGLIGRMPGMAALAPSATPDISTAISPTPPTNPPPTEPQLAIGHRFADGIPSRIDGERVIRPASIERLGPSDDRPFLLGGWLFDYDGVVVACALQIDPYEFGPRCMSPYLTDAPRQGSPVFVEGWALRTGGGPVVLRVHQHDRRAQGCVPERREACELTAVIEAVVWAGDEVTTTAPLTPTEAIDRLLGANPALAGASLTPVPDPDSPVYPTDATPGPPVSVPVAIPACRPQYPPMSWTVSGVGVAHILVFPTTAHREAVDQDFLASGWRGAGGCQALIDAAFLHEWVAVDNVMVSVLVDIDGAIPAQAALVEAIRAALAGTP